MLVIKVACVFQTTFSDTRHETSLKNGNDEGIHLLSGLSQHDDLSWVDRLTKRQKRFMYV